MKRNSGHLMTTLAIFSFLSLSPSEVKRVQRGIASTTEAASVFPRYETLILKVRPETLLKEKEPTEEKFQLKLSELKESLEKSRREFKVKESDEKLVMGQRQEIEAMAIKLLLLDETEKELLKSKEVKKDSAISPLKKTLESLIEDLEINEKLITAKEQVKEPQDKAREVPKEVVKEGPKEEIRDESCDDEKNKALTAQVEELMKQQQEIVKIMAMMTQSILNIQQQQSLYFTQGSAWKTNPYQYQEPFTAGNWVYYPTGHRPEQSNIFGQPSLLQGQNPMQGFYPDQAHQQTLPPVQLLGPQSGSWMVGAPGFGEGLLPQPALNTNPYGMQNSGYNFTPTNGMYF